MDDPTPEELEQERQAAREAAAIGGDGVPADEDPAMAPVREAGGGEAEGFEQAEELLIEHASHGDQQSAHAVIHDAGREEEPDPGRADGEPDREQSSEREDEESPAR
jgi:hypothetical protein